MEEPMKCLVGLLISLGLLVGIRTYSAPPSDEEALVALEQEWSKYSNFTQKDADYLKTIMGKQFITLFPQGTLSILTKENIDAWFSKANADNPEGKAAYISTNIVPHVFGDVALVTYKQKSTATGFKNPDYNVSIEMSVVDTWQKQSGKWKVLCSANASKHPLPPIFYKMQPIP
jgi:ketosteroid isomerase-like protein